MEGNKIATRPTLPDPTWLDDEYARERVLKAICNGGKLVDVSDDLGLPVAVIHRGIASDTSLQQAVARRNELRIMTAKSGALGAVEAVMQRMTEIVTGDSKDADAISAGKVILDVAGVTGKAGADTHNEWSGRAPEQKAADPYAGLMTELFGVAVRGSAEAFAAGARSGQAPPDTSVVLDVPSVQMPIPPDLVDIDI